MDTESVPGIDQPPKSPLADALDGWLLGSKSFLAKVRILLKQPLKIDQVPKARVGSSFTAVEVIDTVAEYFETTAKSYNLSRSLANGRDLAAWMAQRNTTATLRDLAGHFGLSHPQGVLSPPEVQGKGIEGSDRGMYAKTDNDPKPTDQDRPAMDNKMSVLSCAQNALDEFPFGSAIPCKVVSTEPCSV